MKINSIYAPFCNRNWLLQTLMRTVLFLLCTTVFGLAPKPTFSQSKIVIDADKVVSVNQVFKLIKQQTDYTFVYQQDLFKNAPKVQLKKGSIRIDKLLNQSIAADRFNIVLSKDNTILIKKKNLHPQQQVSGRVTDSAGQPIADVTVLVKGTANGTITDAQGQYSLSVPDPAHILVFSSVGFATQEIAAGNQTTIDVVLKAQTEGLNEVIITANLVEMQRKAISSAVTVIDQKRIEQLPSKNIIDLFRGETPGAVSFDTGIYAYTTGITLRGTSSLYANTVKTYIDGVEVSDPLWTGTVDLNNVERVEILRGPQASTLYGSDASGGVLHIYTKKGSSGPPRVSLKVSAGTVASDYVEDTAIRQEHTLSLSGGNDGTTYNLGATLIDQDPYLPEGYTEQKSFSGGVNIKKDKLSIALTTQYSEREFGWPKAPILIENGYTADIAVDETNKTKNQTTGLTLNYAPAENWKHTLTLGHDASHHSYRENTPDFATPSDSLVSLSVQNLNKTSLRYYSTLDFPIGKAVNSTVTLGVDHYKYKFSNFFTSGATPDASSFSADGVFISDFDVTNTGYYAQWVLGVSDKLFITSGIRIENNSSFGKDYGVATAPRIGASYAIDLGFGSLKPRVSYGKGIRPPQPSHVEGFVTPWGIGLPNPDLGPEEQVGVDGGFDFFLKDGLASFELTYYNQTAKDLIDFVSLDMVSFPSVSQYQNIGEIQNSGLELAASLNLASFSLRMTYTRTESTIEKLAPNYMGDYLLGDDLLGVPESSGGATLSYAFPALFSSKTGKGGNVSFGATYIGKLTQNDWLALYGFWFGGDEYRGSGRDYWKEYPAFAKFNLAMDYNISPGLDVFLNINNLFDRQEGEESNIIPSPGRTSMLGLKLNF